MISFTVTRQVAAPPEAVFDTFTDHLAYPKFTALRKASMEREGDPPPNGLGAIRDLRSAPMRFREEVVAYERPSRFAYTLLSGLPVHDHVGTVTFEPVDDGTLVTYQLETHPNNPLVQAALAGFLRVSIRQLVRGASKEAVRRSAAAATASA